MNTKTYVLSILHSSGANQLVRVKGYHGFNRLLTSHGLNFSSSTEVYSTDSVQIKLEWLE